MTITITTDRNPEAWGEECDEETAARAAVHLAQALADYAVETWPEAEITTGTEHVVSGASAQLVRMPGETNDDLYNEVGQAIGQVSEEIWVDSLQAALDVCEDD